MSEREGGKRELTNTEGKGVAQPEGNRITLGNLGEIDTTGLSEEQISALKERQLQTMIDLQGTMVGGQLENATMGGKLEHMTNTARETAESGNSALMQLSEQTKSGSFKATIGTGEEAGKQGLPQGKFDRPLIYVIIGAVAAIVVALIVVGA